MAKKQQLMTKRGESVFPITTTECVLDNEGRHLSEIMGNVKAETFDGDIEEINGKVALFDDMWLSAVGQYGSIDHSREKPYILEGIEHSYEEALYTLKFGITDFGMPSAGYNNYQGKVLLIRNNSRGGQSLMSWCFCHGPNLKVIRFMNGCKISHQNCFTQMPELEYVFGNIQYDSTSKASTDPYYKAFASSPKLKHIELILVSTDVSFENCPLIDIESLKFVVDRRNSNNSPFTVLVHPDVFAKLTDPSNAEWYQLNQDAIAKKITFATV